MVLAEPHGGRSAHTLLKGLRAAGMMASLPADRPVSKTALLVPFYASV